MGLQQLEQEGDYTRFKAVGDTGNIIDLKLTTSGKAVEGPGRSIILLGEQRTMKISWTGKSMWRVRGMLYHQ